MKKLILALTISTLTSTVFAICPTTQSGHATISEGAQNYTVQVALPCAYPNTNYSVSVGGNMLLTLNSKTNSTFVIQAKPEGQFYGSTFDWIAVQN